MRASRGRIRAPRRGLGGVSSGDDDGTFESRWAILSASLQQIHNKNPSALSFETLYRNAYRIVLKNQGDRLYANVQDFEERWLISNVREALYVLVPVKVLGPDCSIIGTPAECRVACEGLMKGLKQAWEDHNLCMNMTTDVMMYMDRVYCTGNKRPSIFTTAMLLFRDHVLRWNFEVDLVEGFVTIEDVLHGIILCHVHMEREGEVVDKSLIRSCVYLLEGLYETHNELPDEKIYLTRFERKYLTASREYYKANAKRTLESSNSAEYLYHVQNCLEEEASRCKSTISDMTSPKIERVVEDELIAEHIDEVMQLEGSGVKHMVENDRIADLNLLYRLISRVDSKKRSLIKALRRQIQITGDHINEVAMEVVEGAAKPKAAQDNSDAVKGPALSQATAAAIQWVDDVIMLKDKYDAIAKGSFASDQGISAEISKSFREFINSLDRSPEFISLFIDENLKRGLKGKTEDEVDKVLDKAIILLQYLADKDKFELYYKKHLSRRLIMKRSVSTDIERQIISRMKQELGQNFTQKLEGMFRDMTISEDLTSSYREYASNLGPKGIDLSISVLTSTYWPVDADPSMADSSLLKCNYPPEIVRLKASFEKFYHSKHSGRRLTWKGHMGTADMRVFFPKDPSAKEGSKATKDRRYEINLPTYSMVILLLFEEVEKGGSLTFDEIHEKTEITEAELTRNLAGLSIAKHRILKKEPLTKRIEASDRFSINNSFVSSFLKFKIGAIAGATKLESDQERVATEKRAAEERDILVDTIVVKIMKERKFLSHLDLVNETIRQASARFTPEIPRIKKRIESLLEREFLRRDEASDTPAYHYVA